MIPEGKYTFLSGAQISRIVRFLCNNCARNYYNTDTLNYLVET
jgi:hypothetical protein